MPRILPLLRSAFTRPAHTIDRRAPEDIATPLLRRAAAPSSAARLPPRFRPVQATTSPDHAPRWRGRFAHGDGQYAFDSPFGTLSRHGTVLVADPRRPLPQAVVALALPIRTGPRGASERRHQMMGEAARTQALAMMLAIDGVPPQVTLNLNASHAPEHDDGLCIDRMAVLYPGSRSNAGAAAFEALQRSLHRLELPPAADRTLIGEILARASSGDIMLAHAILQRLTAGIDLCDRGVVAGAMDQAVERGMWRSAQLLARSDVGFCLLQALQPAGIELGRAARILLQVGDHCLALGEDDAIPAAWTAALASGSPREPSLPAAARRAAMRMLEPRAQLSDAERGVIFAWEQGFREDGPGTALHAVRQRLAKFTHKSIPRVEASRWRSLVWRMCGARKSPLFAMRMGMHGAHLASLAVEHAEARKAGVPGVTSIHGFRRRAPHGCQPHHSPYPRDRRDLRRQRADRAEARSLLDRLIDGMQSSSRVRFADGGRCGMSLQGLTVGLSGFLHAAGIPFGVRLNLSRHRSQRSVLEIACSTGGGEISFGRETRRQNTLGAGAIVGVDLDVAAAQIRCGVGIDLVRRRETSRSAGVVVRVAQRPRSDGQGPDEARMKRGMRAVVDFLFEESHCCQDAGPAAVFDRFAARFFDDPDVSLGGSGQERTSLEHMAAGSVSLTAALGGTGLSTGPVAGISAGRTSVTQRAPHESSGRVRAGAYRAGVQTEVLLGAGLNGKIGAHGAEIGVLNTGLAQFTVPVYRHGRHLKARLWREGGRLQPQACTLDLEFTSIDDYARALCDEIRSWPEVGTGAARDFASATAVANHLASARHFARDNQRFVLRKRLDARVALALDRNAAAADTIRGCAHLPSAQRRTLCAQLDAQASALLARADSWGAPELKVMERAGRLRRGGVLLALQLASETQAEGERSLANLILQRPR